MSCPGSDIDDAGCLHGLGNREGFVTVYPNGTGFFPLKKLRTWNAGGGTDGWNCASGKACSNDIDDLAYVDRLLKDLDAWLNVDRSRVYATGLSNGAAFSHRLACERAGTFAAIAAVAGSNQFSTGAPCNPARPVAVLQVHGTEDPCWSYETTDSKCIGSGGEKLGALRSVTGWVDVLACSDGPTETNLSDTIEDGTTTVATRWSDCDGGVNVLLLTVIGGGHTWPSGSPALSERIVGRITHDWGSEVLWDFLSGYTLIGPGD
jgi:polyhydroxybutyrate depolymerase